MPYKKISVANVVDLLLVITMTAVLVVFATLEYNSEKTRRTARLHNDMVTWAEQMAVSLQLPIWNFDHAQIDKIIESSMRDNTIAAVDVLLADQASSRHVHIRDESWGIKSADRAPVTHDGWATSRDVMADGEKLGTVTVYVTPKFLQAALTATFYRTLLAIALLDVVFTACLYLLLQALVIRPLKKLENHALALSGGAGEIEALEQLRFRGEIESLRRSVATMVRQLRSRYAELALSEQRFRLLVDGVRDYLIVMLDREGRVTTWNAGARRITGYEAEQILGQPAERFLLAGELPGGLTEHLALALRTGRADWTGWQVRSDGTRYWGDAVLTALQDTGDLAGFAVIARDLTAQQQAQELRDRLESQLRQAQKTQALGTLSGGIAHDFNNILAAIRGFATLELEAEDLPELLQESLRQIQRAAERGAALVRRLLTFARPEEPKLAAVSLAAVVGEVAALLRATLPAMISIETRIDEAATYALVDGNQIHQVLMNLGTNAAHAIGGQPGQVRFALQRAIVHESDGAPTHGLAPGTYVCMTVSDTGSGMDPQTVERIFDPFFTTKSREGGTGLGLSVVQGIVRSHGGAVTVHSEPGVGTSFRILLPAAGRDLAPTAAGAGAPPGPAAAAGTGHVLFVDDEAPLVALVSRALEQQGYRVTAITNPVQALAALRAAADGFDVLVTDLAMPGMSGLDLARAARELRSDLPVVVSSGYLRQEDLDAGRAQGVVHFILKTDLLQQIGPILGSVLASTPRGQQRPADGP